MAAQDTIKALRKRVTDLEAEVIHLKRELATANARTLPAREPLDAVGVSAAGRGKVSGCGHGQFCQAIVCRAGR